MNYNKALNHFSECIAPMIIRLYGYKERERMNDAWENYLDGLRFEGFISDRELKEWKLPSGIGYMKAVKVNMILEPR